MLQVGLLKLPFYVASALYVVGLSGFYLFFVATKRYSGTLNSSKKN